MLEKLKDTLFRRGLKATIAKRIKYLQDRFLMKHRKYEELKETNSTDYDRALKFKIEELELDCELKVILARIEELEAILKEIG